MTGCIVFAGGGSGGHISPGLAVAECLREHDDAPNVFFLCSDRPVDTAMLEHAGVAYRAIPARPPGRSPVALARFAVSFARARRTARQLLAERGASLVVTMGGFVAAPVAAAARDLKLPVVLVNLDAPPGRANRWLARRAQRVLSAVDVPDPAGFADEVVGVPIRRQALAPPDRDAAACRAELGLDPARSTLLVTGASQGARTINDLVLDLVERTPGVFAGWQLLHLTGTTDADRVTRALGNSTVPAVVTPFLDAMGLAWGAATLAVSRAGANSVAEAKAGAVPTLFLPYPWHRDAHQARNARPLVAAGGALIVDDLVDLDLNRAEAGAVLGELLTAPERIEAMRAALRALPAENAAERLAAIILRSQ